MNLQQIQQNTAPVRKMIRVPELADIIPTVLLFLAARANVMGLFPFGLAFFAAVYDKKISYIAVLTAAAASIGIMSNDAAVQYMVGIMLFWLYTGIRSDYGQSRVFSSVVCGACMLVGGCFVMIYESTTLFGFMELIAESIITAFMYIVFCHAHSLIRYSRSLPARHEVVSGALCAGVFISGLSDITLPFGINLSRCLTAYAVMCIALNTEAAAAGCGGLAAGFVCSLGSPAAITLMGLYGLGALGANMFRFLGKYGAAMGFLAAVSVAVLYIGNSFAMPLTALESIAAALVFVLTPSAVHERIKGLLKRGYAMEEVAKEDRTREYLCERLAHVRDALTSLAEAFRGVSERRLRMYNRDMASIVNETCERVCTGCADRARCWGEDFAYSWKRVTEILEITEKQGRCTAYNIPTEFKSMCICPESFVYEFGHVYELFKTERLFTEDSVRSRDLLYNQYVEFAHLTEGMIKEFDSGFEFCEKDEERIAEDMELCGISLREISVVENAHRGTEVYLKLNEYPDTKKIEASLERCLGVPMTYEETLKGGLLKFVTSGEFDVMTGKSRIAKENESVSGDSLVFFKTPDYKFYTIICDGMGSGKNAGRDSFISSKLLEKFLRAGFGAKLAINMVNSSLALRLDREGFSSVDLLCVDLLTGQADFYKTGGSKSYIKHGDELVTVFSEGLPAGVFKKLYIKGISKHLEDGDIIVMMSDGVSDAGFGVLSSERIKKLTNNENCDMDKLCDEVIKAAVRKCRGARDDMTVAAVRLCGRQR